jgi:hypothetical protein
LLLLLPPLLPEPPAVLRLLYMLPTEEVPSAVAATAAGCAGDCGPSGCCSWHKRLSWPLHQFRARTRVSDVAE